jgi:hypothetical protein
MNIADGEGPPGDTILRVECHHCAVNCMFFHLQEPYSASGGFDGRTLLLKTNETP